VEPPVQPVGLRLLRGLGSAVISSHQTAAALLWGEAAVVLWEGWLAAGGDDRFDVGPLCHSEVDRTQRGGLCRQQQTPRG
jgi:hypothetical protein